MAECGHATGFDYFTDRRKGFQALASWKTGAIPDGVAAAVTGGTSNMPLPSSVPGPIFTGCQPTSELRVAPDIFEQSRFQHEALPYELFSNLIA
jgi:hypothetical protein